MDAFSELTQLRKRGTRPEGPVVITHSQHIASYYRDPNRGMYVVLLGRADDFSALAGLDVMLIDWMGEKRHSKTGQEILAVRPRFFLTSLWGNRTAGMIRPAKSSVLLQ